MSEVKVVAYRYTASRSFNKPVWHYQATFPSYDNRKVRELGQLQELVLASDHDKRVAELEAELAEAVSLFRLVMDEHPGKERNGNAPGHCHQIPGIWDSDNGAKAGKPCAWCAVWNNAHKFLARHGDPS